MSITEAFENEPVAIVGMGCRFSGTATSPEGLWNMLSKGTTGWSKNANDRFHLDAFWHPKADNKGSFNSKGLHFLKQDPGLFDNDFFGVSGLEAKAMDPQQRLLLEVAYEAFENAGLSMDELEGSQTGVYCSVSNADYESILARDPDISPGYRMTGTGAAILSNRISYFFDLRGPSMTIDTFCSSTLVGLHEAVKAIQSGDIKQALVGGSNLCLDPERIGVLSSMQFTSPDGRCYAFDPRASGYGRGEGIAAIVLKPLGAALADQDTIRAVIRGTGVSSDGRTAGITLPSVHGQIQALKMAYANAGLDPSETFYVEAHGTGTKAGDRTEATVWRKTFCNGRIYSQPLVVGSVKANLGHTEPTAGLAGLIKSVMILEKGVIPPTPTHQQLSQDVAVALEGSIIQVATKNLPWPADVVRRISINATGYGGTDAHVVIEHVDDILSKSAKSISKVDNCPEAVPRVFAISHRRPEGLKEMARVLKRSLSERWAQQSESLLRNLAFTLSKRSHLGYRSTFVASSMEEVHGCLDQIVKGVQRLENAGPRPGICFAFTGQGAQWAKMGLDLLPLYPVFAVSMRHSEQEFLQFGADWHLLQELDKVKSNSSINQAWLSQPCCTAVQMAVVDLLASWGIQPQVVCGHSSGEIAAAYAAGVLTSSEALKVAYFRGYHVESLRKSRPHLSGSMIAVGLSAEDVLKYMGDGKKATVACINSPSSVTISGDSVSLLEVKKALDADGVFNRKLDVDVAYHSSHMKFVEDDYRSALKDIQPKPTKDGVRMISSVTGRLINGNEMDAAYWTQNLISPVRFSQALINILKSRETWVGADMATTTLIVEVGPHAALRGPINQIIKTAGVQSSTIYLTALKRYESGPQALLELSGDIFRRGATVDFQAINEPNKVIAESPRLLVNLPHYVWHHEKPHWAESRRSFAYRFRQFPKHDILGTSTLDNVSAEPTWRVYLRVSDLPWLKGHVIQDQVVFPGAGYVSMVVEALKAQHMIQKLRWKGLTIHFRDVSFTRVLLVPETEVGIETVISLRPYSYSAKESSSSWTEFRVFTLSPDGRQSTEHCRGIVSLCSTQIGGSFLRAIAPENVGSKLSSEKLYKELKALGANYTGHVAQLKDIQGGHGFAHCTFKIPDLRPDMPGKLEQPYCIHPLSLEAAFQSAFAALRLNNKLETVHLLEGFDELHICTDVPSQPGTVMCVETEVGSFGISKNKADILVSAGGNEKGQAFIRAKGVMYAGLQATAQDSDGVEEESLCHRIDWIIDPFNSSSRSLRSWVKQQAVASSSQSHRVIFDQYCQSVIKHLLQSQSSKDSAQLVGFQSRLLEWMQSQNLDAAWDMSPNLEKQILAVGEPGRTIVQLANFFTQILQRKADSSQSLLTDYLVQRLYVEDASLQRCFANLANYLRLCRLKTPKIRILEIGTVAGNLRPSVGRIILTEEHPDLKVKDCNCVYADITTTAPVIPSDFEDLDGLIEYKRLDLEQPFEKQGFQAGSFDVIVATTLSHIVSNQPDVLTKLRSLLKPQGAMTLVEITMPSLKWEMISRCQSNGLLSFGATDSKSRFLNSKQWRNRLNHSGFTGFTEVKDSDPEQDHEASLLIASAISPISGPTQSVTIISRSEENRIAGYLASQIGFKIGHGSVVHTRLDDAVANENIFIFLLEISQPFIGHQTKDEWRKIQKIMSQAGRVLWVTKNGDLNCPDPANGLVTGFARSLRVEFPELRFITLDIDPAVMSESQIADDIHRIYAAYLGDEMSTPKTQMEWEFAIQNGAVLVPRVFSDKITSRFIQDSTSTYHPQMTPDGTKDRALGLKIRSAGMFDTLYWVDMPEHCRSPKPDEVRVEMQAFSMNSWDVMTARGELDGNSTFLMEGAGIVREAGQQVEGFSVGDVIYSFNPKGLATTSNIYAQRAIRIPHGMDIRTAVAVPLAYGTALHCLRDIARMQPGESILIHSAAGAVGQAAIALAKYYQAGEIFVTASSPDKKEMLQSKWGILAANIFSSRDLEFGASILKRTQNRGVDIVLNSLTAEAVHEGCSILAPFGRFIEIGRRDLLSNRRLGMKAFAKNATFTAVDMAVFAEIKPLALGEIFATVIGLINTSQVRLFDPITIKPLTEIEETFRLMQSGTHVGKVVLDVASNMSLKTQPPPPKMARLRDDASYLVVGGTGGLGKVIIRFLVTLGAKRIITMSRSGGGSPGMKEFTEEIRRKGAALEVVQGSVVDLDMVERIKKESGRQVVRGVIHAATVFEDAPFEQMTFEQWREGIQAKVTGTVNLHAVFGQSVDFFTMLSSVVGVQGTYAQVNYNAANAFQDAFAQSCAAQNLPARSLDLSMVADEGQGAQAESIEFLQRHGLRQISLDVVTAAVHYTILNPVPSSPAHAQILCGFRQEHPDSGTKIAALQRPDARFSHIWFRPSDNNSAAVKDGEYDVQSALQSSTSAQMAIQAAFTALKKHISQLLDVAESTIEPDRTVASYGLDSLTAMELRKFVNTRLSSPVQMLEIMNPMSIMDFAELVAKKSRFVNAAVFEDAE